MYTFGPSGQETPFNELGQSADQSVDQPRLAGPQEGSSSPFQDEANGSPFQDSNSEAQSNDSPFEAKSQDSPFESKSQDSPFEAKSQDSPFEAKSQDSPFEAKSQDSSPFSTQGQNGTVGEAPSTDSPFAAQANDNSPFSAQNQNGQGDMPNASAPKTDDPFSPQSNNNSSALKTDSPFVESGQDSPFVPKSNDATTQDQSNPLVVSRSEDSTLSAKGEEPFPIPKSDGSVPENTNSEAGSLQAPRETPTSGAESSFWNDPFFLLYCGLGILAAGLCFLAWKMFGGRSRSRSRGKAKRSQLDANPEVASRRRLADIDREKVTGDAVVGDADVDLAPEGFKTEKAGQDFSNVGDPLSAQAEVQSEAKEVTPMSDDEFEGFMTQENAKESPADTGEFDFSDLSDEPGIYPQSKQDSVANKLAEDGIEEQVVPTDIEKDDSEVEFSFDDDDGGFDEALFEDDAAVEAEDVALGNVTSEPPAEPVLKVGDDELQFSDDEFTFDLTAEDTVEPEVEPQEEGVGLAGLASGAAAGAAAIGALASGIAGNDTGDTVDEITDEVVDFGEMDELDDFLTDEKSESGIGSMVSGLVPTTSDAGDASADHEENQKLTAELLESKRLLEVSNDEKAELQREVKELEQKTESLNKHANELDEVGSKLKQAETKQESLLTQIEEFELEKESLNQRLEESLAENEKLSESAKKLTESAQEQDSSLREELKSAQDLLGDRDAEIEKLRASQAKQKQKLASLAATSASKSKVTQTDSVAAGDEAEKVRKIKRLLEKTKLAARIQIQKARDESSRLQTELDAAKALAKETKKKMRT